VTEAPLAAERPERRLRPDLAAAGAVFVGVLCALLGSLWLSAALFGPPDALWSNGEPVRLARFCALLALVTAYLVAATVLLRRGASGDFAALRLLTDTTPERWESWERRFTDARLDGLYAGAGVVAGLVVHQIGTRLGTRGAVPWAGLFWWSAFANALLFAILAVLARRSVLEIRALRAVGRRVRVSLLDRSGLAPFVRAGLRSAVTWLVGSSLALLLVIDVNSPVLVLGTVGGTMALGIAALLLPSAGLNERLRAEKQRELAWVRGEIARAREALARPDAASRDEASRLPVLLAWEARIDAAGTWPFDPPTMLRFSLLLLVPLGSWLGGALVERAVSAAMGD
jgi:hypothetical protein